ncbi:leucyl/phenylalanyl-tRNA--protein transferase [Mesobacterium pallidum]|uniref:leucyl/phenylalanyl-tRNA--protein transferase n=1 Tax=Mesobacterium pallidum TaxID=2872037 RepID=UPI001EE24016|nr:leucyl/phenylalanyl-tRNA--protein transferase [Mesobacterium pallidum]
MKDHTDLTPDLLLRAYTAGLFPMAEHRDDPELFWVDPRRRGIFPLGGFHISRSLARRIRAGGFDVRVNTDFAGVVEGCADRPETWISDPIRHLYMELFLLGYAHSLEVHDDDGLIGGVYGVTIGAAFFGESMFSRKTDASKIALAYLVDRLNLGGFRLFDTQFLTPHLASLGAIEISRAAYHSLLKPAIAAQANFLSPPLPASGHEVVQRNTQTS